MLRKNILKSVFGKNYVDVTKLSRVQNCILGLFSFHHFLTQAGLCVHEQLNQLMGESPRNALNGILIRKKKSQ